MCVCPSPASTHAAKTCLAQASPACGPQGKLSWEETIGFFAKKGATPKDARDIFNKADVDNNGFIDRQEFRRLHKMLKNAWFLAPYPRAPPPPPLDRFVCKGATRALAAGIVAAVALKMLSTVARG